MVDEDVAAAGGAEDGLILSALRMLTLRRGHAKRGEDRIPIAHPEPLQSLQNLTRRGETLHFANDVLRPSQLRIEAYLQQTQAVGFRRAYKPTAFEAGRQILELPPEELLRTVRALVVREVFVIEKFSPRIGFMLGHVLQNEGNNLFAGLALKALFGQILRRRLPFSEADFLDLLNLFAFAASRSDLFFLPTGSILHVLESLIQEQGLSLPLKHVLERILRHAPGRIRNASDKEMWQSIEKIPGKSA